MQDIAKILLLAGAVLLAAGALILLVERFFGPGGLPGDIVVRRGGFRLHIPIATSILLSLLLSGLLWLLRK